MDIKIAADSVCPEELNSTDCSVSSWAKRLPINKTKLVIN